MSFWTPEREAELRQLWSQGLTASQIAARLGASSRNSIIGKVHRLGLSQPKGARLSREEINRLHNERRRERRARGVERRSSGRYTSLPYPEKLPSEPQTQLAGVSAGKGVTLLELTWRTCRWPLWGPDTDHGEYCGARPVDGLPYCVTHCRMAYRPAEQRTSRRRAA
jgi:GcrA cell cycle regulator